MIWFPRTKIQSIYWIHNVLKPTLFIGGSPCKNVLKLGIFLPKILYFSQTTILIRKFYLEHVSLNLSIWVPNQIKTPINFPSQIYCLCILVYWLQVCDYLPSWRWRDFQIENFNYRLPWLSHDSWKDKRIWIHNTWCSEIPKLKIIIMLWNQKISWGCENNFWCFFYQYNVWMVWCITKPLIGMVQNNM